MRKLVVFLLVMATAFASCEEYALSAVNDFGPSCVYPQCFGAAARYKEAALCYSDQSDVARADIYFKKAAEYYLQGITYIGPAGDYPLRAPSYEYAGDMEAKLGNRVLAANHYDSAMSEYLKLEDYAKADAVMAKKVALERPVEEEPQTGFAVSAENLVLGGIVIIVAIAVFFYMRRPGKTEEAPAMPAPAQPIFRPPEEPSGEPAKTPAKEKMRDKIRKKYGLE